MEGKVNGKSIKFVRNSTKIKINWHENAKFKKLKIIKNWRKKLKKKMGQM